MKWENSISIHNDQSSARKKEKCVRGKQEGRELKVNKHFIWILFWNKKSFTWNANGDAENLECHDYCQVAMLNVPSGISSSTRMFFSFNLRLNSHNNSPVSFAWARNAVSTFFFGHKNRLFFWQKTVKIPDFIFHAKSFMKCITLWYDAEAFYADIISFLNGENASVSFSTLVMFRWFKPVLGFCFISFEVWADWRWNNLIRFFFSIQ